MSQHFEMTDATPLACSVIVIQSYAKVASTLLHFTNQIGVLKGSIDHKLQYLRTPIRYLGTCTHFCQFLPLSLYSYQITVMEVTLEIVLHVWEMRLVDDVVLSILYYPVNGTFHNL